MKRIRLPHSAHLLDGVGVAFAVSMITIRSLPSEPTPLGDLLQGLAQRPVEIEQVGDAGSSAIFSM